VVLNDDDVIDWDDENPPLMGDECPQGTFTWPFIPVSLPMTLVVQVQHSVGSVCRYVYRQ